MNADVRPGVYTRVLPSENLTPPGTRRTIIPCLVGRGDYKTNTEINEEITKGATPSDNLEQLYPIEIHKVGDLPNTTTYIKDVDYELDEGISGQGSIVWLDNPIASPVQRDIDELNVGTTGGVPLNTYYVVVTATRDGEETVQSNEKSYVVAEAGNHLIITWQITDTLADGYKVYISTTTGVYSDTLAGTITGGGSTTFTWDGAAVGTGTPPGATTAYRKPIEDEDYYVSYDYKTWENILEPTLYINLADVQKDFGKDSPLGVAAMLAMGRNGLGNNADKVWVIALNPETTGDVAAHTEALSVAHKIDDLILMVPVQDVPNENVHLAYLNHCQQQSSTTGKKERAVVFGPAEGTPWGPASVPGTVLFNISLYDNNPHVRYIANDGCRVEVEDGVWEDFSSAYLAAAYAGMRASVSNPSISTTLRRVNGQIKLGSTNSAIDVYNDSVLDMLQAAGALVMYYDKVPAGFFNGTIKILRDQTVDLIHGPEYRESCIWEVAAYIDRKVRSYLADLNIIPNPDTVALRDKIIRAVNAILQQEVEVNTIASFANTVVEEDPHPNRRKTGLLVKCRFRPLYPVNTIFIERSFIV